jgi:uncharacterized DUF497 family protein
MWYVYFIELTNKDISVADAMDDRGQQRVGAQGGAARFAHCHVVPFGGAGEGNLRRVSRRRATRRKSVRPGATGAAPHGVDCRRGNRRPGTGHVTANVLQHIVAADPRVTREPVPDAPGPSHSFSVSDDELITGDPNSAADQIASQCSAVGAGHFFRHHQHGGAEARHAGRTPAVRQRGHSRAAAGLS